MRLRTLGLTQGSLRPLSRGKKITVTEGGKIRTLTTDRLLQVDRLVRCRLKQVQQYFPDVISFVLCLQYLSGV